MLKPSFLILIACAFTAIPSYLSAQCNGHQELCGKRYNEVAYLTTHNAYNAEEDGFSLPNQTFGLTRQLEDGVRGLMLDVYDEGGVATAYHGFAFLGTATLESNLTEIKDFLDANPNEVVTIIFETYISSNMMDTVMTQVGLKPMLAVQELGQPWPTLQEMIDANKRLVVLSDHDNGQPGQDWYHYLWDFAVETHFENNAPSDFSCDFNRGNASNDLFIINHFVTDANIGTGLPNQAEIINQLDYFYDRVHGCQIEKQKFPNFSTVDFHERGQTLAVVDSLNGVSSFSSVGIENVRKSSVSISPNPSNGIFNVERTASASNSNFQLFDVNGKRVLCGVMAQQSILDLTSQSPGIYFLSVENLKGMEFHRLVSLPN